MKKLILALAIATASSASMSYTCEQIESMAANIMQARQDGATLISVRNTLDDMGLWNDYQNMAIDAYTYPKWGSKDRKQAEVTEFRNDYYMICLELQR